MSNLYQIWRIWKRIGQIIGNWIAGIVLTAFYFTIFAPFGLGIRLWSDPLAIKYQHQVQWLECTTRDPTLDEARRLS